ncbi:hypothetical protein ABZ436_27005 [Micromonospora matsumotoense]|uniref:hypothetical protein n=1 Tax=Micromonospora matsumotoense TaxID=121616 RepID=UPI0033E44AEF
MRRARTATTTGRWLRLLLLVGTLLGLSAMHTLGHHAELAGGHHAELTGSHDAELTGGNHAELAGGHHADGRPAGHGTSADRAHRNSGGHDTPVGGPDRTSLDRPDRTPAGVPATDRLHLAGPVRPATVTVVRPGCGDGCAVALPAGPSGAPPTAWSVCLAVLGALTVTVLVLLFVVRSRPAGVARPPSRPREPRAPPPRPLRLRLATVSVLRR